MDVDGLKNHIGSLVLDLYATRGEVLRLQSQQVPEEGKPASQNSGTATSPKDRPLDQ